MLKLKRNALRCKLCGDVIESTTRHELVWCKCGSVFVDGGLEYLRRGIKPGLKYDDVVEDLSESEEV